MIDGENLDNVTFEVFTCCEQFRARVYEELMRELYHTNKTGPIRTRGFTDFGFAL
ncbi:MAG TPA: hypothetical protein VMP11_00540 [Verrucomicrobiae bacterium]|nr:hypothetical protein [Verrucomicrobiae bacterium]